MVDMVKLTKVVTKICTTTGVLKDVATRKDIDKQEKARCVIECIKELNRLNEELRQDYTKEG